MSLLPAVVSVKIKILSIIIIINNDYFFFLSLHYFELFLGAFTLILWMVFIIF